jgi:hypothetical protein
MLRKANAILNESTWKRKHRTMVVIEIDENYSGDYRERVERFIGSLNKPETIKADVFVMFDGVLEPLESHLIKPKGKLTGSRSMRNLRKFASKAGYVQVCLLCESWK